MTRETGTPSQNEPGREGEGKHPQAPADPIGGTAPAPLSILDLATIGNGGTPSQALRATTELARRAEEWGYQRFWVAEHHSMPGVASSSPAVLIAHLAAATSTLRIGSGGVMLPNHAPLIVAEQFGLLHALHPGRIDLGIGRAPGTHPATVQALRRAPGDDLDAFLQQITELGHFLDGTFPSGHPYQGIQAVPCASMAPGIGRPPLWLLGTSESSARLAGQLGLPFSFGHHFTGINTVPALDAYRRSFRPSAVLDEPYALVSVHALAADSENAARRLARSVALATLRLRRGMPYPVPTPQEAADYPYSTEEAQFVENWLAGAVLGEPDQVRQGLEDLRKRTGAQEIMVTSQIHGRQERLYSYELIAKAYGMTVDR